MNSYGTYVLSSNFKNYSKASSVFSCNAVLNRSNKLDCFIRNSAGGTAVSFYTWSWVLTTTSSKTKLWNIKKVMAIETKNPAGLLPVQTSAI